MKTRIFILATILSIVFVSCKKDADTNNAATTNAAAEVKPNFKVVVDAITDKDDDFAVYYTEDGSINFTAEKSLWAGIKAGQQQEVIFQFPEDATPKAIRLDFGLKRKENQGNVSVKSVKFTCYGKNFDVKGSDFLNYFRVNDSIETAVDANAGTITFKQNLKNDSPAFYYPNMNLISEIEKLEK